MKRKTLPPTAASAVALVLLGQLPQRHGNQRLGPQSRRRGRLWSLSTRATPSRKPRWARESGSGPCCVDAYLPSPPCGDQIIRHLNVRLLPRGGRGTSLGKMPA